mmetsp:Transcript_44039/g.42621  ORF Transcript_44039/g.42621 Transcript_44039/m.42621 type:complete len:101 (-) Transcript_44039:69-371(-)
MLPKEQVFFLQVKALKMAGDLQVQLTLDVFYSPANNIPELYFRLQDIDSGKYLSDCSQLVLNYEKNQDLENKMFYITKKEHPTDNLITFYLHECQLNTLI